MFLSYSNIWANPPWKKYVDDITSACNYTEKSGVSLCR